MTSVLITGANGQLGVAMRNALEHGCFDSIKPFFTDVDTLDICDLQQVNNYIREHGIDFIVNCAAYTAVDRAEDDAEVCDRINRLAVRNLGKVASAAGARIIHISTDYVFDGLGSRPYREDDPVNPTSIYGVTKLAGEQALMAACPASIIIRTAWLYSETGNNFVKTMLRLGSVKDEIGVVADQRGTPTCAGDLADVICKILESNRFYEGIYHYTNEGECTWFDFAVKIMELAGLTCRVRPLTTAEYPTRATRPAYSVLDKSRIRNTFGISIPQWETSLQKCLDRLLHTSQ